MQKKFLTNLGLLLLVNFLVKPFWILGIDRSVQNLVGFEEYGFYAALLNFSFLFNILLDLGITNFNNRSVAQNKDILPKYLSGIVILRFLLAVVYFLVILIVGLMIGYKGRQLEMLAMIGVNQFLLSFLLYLRSNISGLLMFKAESLLSVLDRLIMILMIGVMLIVKPLRLHFRIEWFVYAQTAAYIGANLVALSFIMRKARLKKLNWNPAFFRTILRNSLPFAILTLLMSTYNRIDPVLIERLLPENIGDQQAGIYASAYRLLDAATMVPYLFSLLLLPLFSNMLKRNESVKEIVRISFTLLFSISFLTAATALLYSRPLMELLYPIHATESVEEFIGRINESSFIFTVLMFGFIAISITYVYGTLLTANGNLWQLNLLAALSVVINISINFLLIPELHASGAAIASLSSQTFAALLQGFMAFRLVKLQIDRQFILRSAAFMLTVIICIFLLKLLIYDNYILGSILLWLLGTASIIAFKMINLKEILELFKSDISTSENS